jgi:hypothetical protein
VSSGDGATAAARSFQLFGYRFAGSAVYSRSGVLPLAIILDCDADALLAKLRNDGAVAALENAAAGALAMPLRRHHSRKVMQASSVSAGPRLWPMPTDRPRTFFLRFCRLARVRVARCERDSSDSRKVMIGFILKLGCPSEPCAQIQKARPRIEMRLRTQSAAS